MFRKSRILVALTLVATGACSQQAVDPKAIAAKVEAAFVQVDFTLQFDKGDAPASVTSANRFMGFAAIGDLESLVREERPLETAGLLLDPTTVITVDPLIHPRFVKRIEVRLGGKTVEATPQGYLQRQNAIILRLAGSLAGGTPLKFAREGKAQYSVSFAQTDCRWNTKVAPTSKTVTIAGGHLRRDVPAFCVLVDAAGMAVGLSAAGELLADGSWKGSPLDQSTVSATERSRLIARIGAVTEKCLARVKLNFRSPKKKGARTPFSFLAKTDEDEDSTERHVVGALVAADRVLVLVNLKPSATARLKRILVHLPGREPIRAKFLHTLADHGAFVAALDSPVDQHLELSDAPVTDYRNDLLCFSEVKMQGEKRVAYHSHGRFGSVVFGWRRRTHPAIHGNMNLFLFDTDGRLVALPLGRRQIEDAGDRWARYGASSEPLLTAASIRRVLDDLAAHSDASNVPLSEAEENRLAWLGVVLQPMTKELARVNEVSDLTGDGETGGLVSFVYPASPAMTVGIQPGDVLLRLHAEGRSKPLAIKVEGSDFLSDLGINVPAGMMDEFFAASGSKPWPSAGTQLNRMLTELGFGKRFEVEFFSSGKVIRKELSVSQGPPHFDSAPRHKSKTLGVDVRNLTYEVRTHFQLKAEDPGVIVSKVDSGELAAISGIRLFDIVTQIDGKPVVNVDDFAKFMSQKGERRLFVKRKARTRIVKIKVP